MQNTQPRYIRTGGDPRSFADFAALRDEMSKQTHPARPDIHWDRVEQLALLLFEKNGIELQTGAWYTLARSHLARVAGMSEGLNIIAAMLSHHWAQFWPQPSHPRAEILSGLFQRLQKIFRTFTLSHEDRSPLLQLEVTLDGLSATLQRQGLQQVSQIAPLLQQVRNALIRLDNAPGAPLPVALAGAFSPQEHAVQGPPLLYVIQQERSANVEVIHETRPVPKRADAFMYGMLTACVLNAAVFTAGYYLTRPSEAEQAMARTLQPLPRVADIAYLPALKYADKKGELATHWLKQAAGRLNALSTLPPDWNIRYGQALVTQAQTLWPDLPGTKQLENVWQQKLALNRLTEDSLTGWYDGMRKLQKLAGQLNALDGQKGKYMTVSELKSSVFGMMSSFQQAEPTEEQLRQVQRLPAASPQRQQIIRQLEQHLRSQIYTLGQMNNSTLMTEEQRE